MKTGNSDRTFEAFCEDLEAYVEGTLPVARRAEIELFLEHSQEARALLAEFREANSWFDQVEWTVPEPKSLPTAQVILDQAVKRQGFWRRFVAGFSSRWFFGSSRALAALAVVVVMVGVTWYVLHSASYHFEPEKTASVRKDEQSSRTLESGSPADESGAPPPAARPAQSPSPVGQQAAAPEKQAAAMDRKMVDSEGPASPGDGRTEAGRAAAPAAAPAPSAAQPGGSLAKSEPAPQFRPDLPAEVGEKAKNERDTVSSSEVAGISPAVAPQEENKKRNAGMQKGEVLSAQSNTISGGGGGNRMNAPSPARPATSVSSSGVHTVTLDLVVADLETTRAQFSAVTLQNRGTVSGSQGGDSRLFLTAQVPSENLSAYLARLRRLGRVEHEQTQVRGALKEGSNVGDEVRRSQSSDADKVTRQKQDRGKDQGEVTRVIVRVRLR